MLLCSNCQQEKDSEEYSKTQRRAGINRRCRECISTEAPPVEKKPTDPSEDLLSSVAAALTPLHVDPLAAAVVGKQQNKGASPALMARPQLPKNFPMCVRPRLDDCIFATCPASIGASSSLSSRNVISTSNGQERSLFLPAGPLWVNDLARVAGNKSDTVFHEFMQQRETDYRLKRLMTFAYKDIPTKSKKLSALDHMVRFAKFGFELDLAPGDYAFPEEVMASQLQLEPLPDWVATDDVAAMEVITECGYCQRPIQLHSPPECLCGEPFCSIDCHAAAWPSHKAVCQEVAEAHGEALQATKKEWMFLHKVLRDGLVPDIDWVPRPDPRDFESEALQECLKKIPNQQQQGTVAATSCAPECWEVEYAFYGKHEKPRMLERITILQKAAKAVTKAREKSLWAKMVIDEVLWQFEYFSIINSKDSVGRLLAKASMLLSYETLFTEVGLDNANIRKIMKGHVDEARKRGLVLSQNKPIPKELHSMFL